MIRETIFSPDRVYRYTLWREWIGGTGYVQFIGLNPSTADETIDDPTIRRCIGFAKAWGYGALCMTNLFAYRSTDPLGLLAVEDPIGPDNDAHLVGCARDAGQIVAAWGVGGTLMDRAEAVRGMMPGLSALKLTKAGHPGHPLYLPKDLRPIAWRRP